MPVKQTRPLDEGERKVRCRKCKRGDVTLHTVRTTSPRTHICVGCLPRKKAKSA
jgi:hypothetical protein